MPWANPAEQWQVNVSLKFSEDYYCCTSPLYKLFLKTLCICIFTRTEYLGTGAGQDTADLEVDEP